MGVPLRKGEGFLEEFKAFLSFLKNVWGLLAGISVFFPLSNVFTSVIPLQSIFDDGAFVRLTPAFVTGVSTLVTLFIVLWTFSSRSEIKRIKHRAIVSFLVGIASLILYMIIYELKLSAYELWGWESEDSYHFLAEIPLLLSYAVFFALMTRAFMLLGLLEYYRTKQ